VESPDFKAAVLSKRDSSDQTLLHVASENGHKSVVEVLFCHPSLDINAATVRGETPVSLASRNGYVTIVSLLVKQPQKTPHTNGDKKTALIYAAEYGHDRIASLLLSLKDIETNCRDSAGTTTLHLAAYKGFRHIANSLLEIDNIDVNVKKNKRSWELTPLTLASAAGYNGIVSSFWPTQISTSIWPTRSMRHLSMPQPDAAMLKLSTQCSISPISILTERTVVDVQHWTQQQGISIMP
jgi:ankyrin repeat protein